MRGFLILLAILTPLVLINPVFWWLVQSEVDAAPGAVVEADGAVRASFIGPRSPWPEWAVVPLGGELTPRLYYGPAPGHPAMGFGDVALPAPPERVIAQLQRALMAEGWSVSAVRYRVAEPSPPPILRAACTVMAQRPHGDGLLTVQYGFHLTPGVRIASMHWREGPPLPSWPTLETLPEWTQPESGC